MSQHNPKVKSSTYTDFDKENNKEEFKYKVVNQVRISKYKNVFAENYIPNWSEVFMVKRVENAVLQTYVISDLNGEENIGTFCEKELGKTNQKEFRVEKVIKKKGEKLYVKCKYYDDSFNSWIYKKRYCYIK